MSGTSPLPFRGEGWERGTSVRDARVIGYAKQMRRAPSEPERRLWLTLRAKRFDGIKFRRQKVIGGYIVDFAARDPMLVVEVDGESHGESAEYDARRTAFLASQGYGVLRFTNLDVMNNLEGVLSSIAAFVSTPLSQPFPLKGRGL